MQFLSLHEELGQHFNEYMKETYSMGYEEFIYTLLSMYASNNRNGENNIKNEFTGEIDTTFYYSVREVSAPMFRTMSRVIRNDKPERLLSIRKSPFNHTAGNNFCLIDNILLLDKGYNQFINDFWFDKVKGLALPDGKLKFPIKKYRSIIGYFFEWYTRKIFNHFFENQKYWVHKSFEELKVMKDGQEIELADFYVRSNNKIFLGQAKSTGLYDTEKYGGDVDSLYKNNREDFFKSFGVNQLIESIKNLELTIGQVDKNFPLGKAYHIYPAVVVNDKALQTQFMAKVFNERFQELATAIKKPKITIYPMSIIHVSDFEQMEDVINQNAKIFWNILDFNRRYPKFIPPFYNTLNQMNIKPGYKNPKQLFEELIPKYQIIPDEEL
jgi:hypothetical protein